jgi:hypothetical protein
VTYAQTGMYALIEDLAASLQTTPGYVRWAASKYGWRKIRIGHRVRYHVEDAYRDLGTNQEKRRRKKLDKWLEENWDTREAEEILDMRSRRL